VLLELQVEWPSMGTGVLSDCLPSTLQSLTVAVQDRTHGNDVIDTLQTKGITLILLQIWALRLHETSAFNTWKRYKMVNWGLQRL